MEHPRHYSPEKEEYVALSEILETMPLVKEAIHSVYIATNSESLLIDGHMRNVQARDIEAKYLAIHNILALLTEIFPMRDQECIAPMFQHDPYPVFHPSGALRMPKNEQEYIDLIQKAGKLRTENPELLHSFLLETLRFYESSTKAANIYYPVAGSCDSVNIKSTYDNELAKFLDCVLNFSLTMSDFYQFLQTHFKKVRVTLVEKDQSQSDNTSGGRSLSDLIPCLNERIQAIIQDFIGCFFQYKTPLLQKYFEICAEYLADYQNFFNRFRMDLYNVHDFLIKNPALPIQTTREYTMNFKQMIEASEVVTRDGVLFRRPERIKFEELLKEMGSKIDLQIDTFPNKKIMDSFLFIIEEMNQP